MSAATTSDSRLGADLVAVLERLERATDSFEGHGLDDEAVQRLLGAAVRAYCQAVEVRDRAVDPFPTRPDGSVSITGTEAVATATEMLRAVEIEPFELGMWWSRGSLYTRADETTGETAR